MIRLNSGFTLIEIMVALGVLAISGVALLGNIGQATTDLTKLEDKVDALVLAEYTLNAVLLEHSFPDLINDEQLVQRSGRDWRVKLTVSETPREDVRRIDVMVSPQTTEVVLGRVGYNTVMLSGFKVDIY
ncbi:MAG: type II secretion system minor pseudopilin GspI [Pseudomonadota bacterium]|nr:type II secretion system minor pseudopilin GspI [Pseudomonadota bacterium]